MANTLDTTSGSGSSALSNMPDDVAVGDFVWLWINSDSASATISSGLTGWTLAQMGDLAVDFTPWVYYKIWQSGDTAPTVGFSTTVGWTMDAMRIPGYTYDNSSKTSPVNAVSVTNSITPVANNCKVFFFASVDATGGARTWTHTGSGTEILDRLDGTMHRQVVQLDLTGGGGASQSTVHTVTGSTQDQLGIALSIKPVTTVNVKHKYKSGGVFTARPIMHKSGGVFTYRPIKSKTSGVFS
jgi:hypothetical protein